MDSSAMAPHAIHDTRPRDGSHVMLGSWINVCAIGPQGAEAATTGLWLPRSKRSMERSTPVVVSCMRSGPVHSLLGHVQAARSATAARSEPGLHGPPSARAQPAYPYRAANTVVVFLVWNKITGTLSWHSTVCVSCVMCI